MDADGTTGAHQRHLGRDYEMMRIIVVLLLSLTVILTRKGGGPPARCYLGFVLVSAGSLLWASTFDVLGPGKDVVTDAALYQRVLLLSTTGVAASVAGSIVSLWCRQKLLKMLTMFVGAASTLMCSINILLPY